MSRHRAVRSFRADDIQQSLAAKGIYIKAASKKVVAEEAPQAYKDVDDVVEITHRAGLARKVAKLRPLGVVKG
jgi:tRNA-splicing ligase RtcB